MEGRSVSSCLNEIAPGLPISTCKPAPAFHKLVFNSTYKMQTYVYDPRKLSDYQGTLKGKVAYLLPVSHLLWLSRMNNSWDLSSLGQTSEAEAEAEGRVRGVGGMGI